MQENNAEIGQWFSTILQEKLIIILIFSVTEPSLRLLYRLQHQKSQLSEGMISKSLSFLILSMNHVRFNDANSSISDDKIKPDQIN